MGLSLFEVDGLAGVLERVTARTMSIPRGRRLVVENRQPKVVLFQEGEVRVSINKRELGVGRPGDLLVVPGACRQAFEPVVARAETRFEVLVLFFRPGVFAVDAASLQAMPTGGQADPEMREEEFLGRYFGTARLIAGAVGPAALAQVEAMREEAEARRVGFRYRVAAHAWLLLTEIARRGQGAEAPANDVPAGAAERGAWLAERVKRYLIENHAEEVTLERVAWHLRLSAEHLARVFKRETGGTIHGYLESLRVSRAQMHLEATALPMGEIARLSGFATASQFCRTFRRVTGKTPSEHRHASRGRSFSPSQIEQIVR